MALLSLLARRTLQAFGSDCLQAEQDLVRDDDSYLTRMAIGCQGPREILPFEGVSDGIRDSCTHRGPESDEQ